MNDFESEINKAFKNKVRSYLKAEDLYSSLCNVRWQKKDQQPKSVSWRSAGSIVASIRNSLKENGNPENCAYCGKKLKEHFAKEENTQSFLNKKETVIKNYYCHQDCSQKFRADHLGNEDYLDFYLSGREGEVVDWVEKTFNGIGYYKVFCSDQ
jgi:hypothetical protein